MAGAGCGATRRQSRNVSSDEARGAVLRLGQRKDVNRFTIAGRAGSQRAVVVERITRRPLRTGSIGR
jgi:hypothetical protein